MGGQQWAGGENREEKKERWRRESLYLQNHIMENDFKKFKKKNK